MNKYTSKDYLSMQKAIEFLVKHFSELKEPSKPIIIDAINTGNYLFTKSYPANIVIAGYLHDIVEDTDVTINDIKEGFGEDVALLVQANTKDQTIEQSSNRREELISRCVSNSESAAIVKAADILDNYLYYSNTDNTKGVDYCLENAGYFKKHLPSNYTDTIFKKVLELVP